MLAPERGAQVLGYEKLREIYALLLFLLSLCGELYRDRERRE